LKPQAWRSMWGWIFTSKPAALPARSTIAWKPRLENGAPRSLMKTKGDLATCPRCIRLTARNSLLVNGCVAGLPFFDSTDVQERVFEVNLLPTEDPPIRYP
jgi:hypothetical protein